MNRLALLALAVFALAPLANANVTTTQGNLADLAEGISSTDLIQGLIATELPGDQGWHPANTDPNDQLPALTDGAADLSGLTGLLNDFPGSGQPAKRLRYDLPAPADVAEVRVFSMAPGMDGRLFHTYTVEFSSDSGGSWSDPIYVQSHPSGTTNGGQWKYALTQLTATGGGSLATNVDALRFDLYAADNTADQARDPFDGVNPFTLVDDSLTAAFVSPAILEIDVVEVPEPASLAALLTGGLALLRRRR